MKGLATSNWAGETSRNRGGRRAWSHRRQCGQDRTPCMCNLVAQRERVAEARTEAKGRLECSKGLELAALGRAKQDIWNVQPVAQRPWVPWAWG